jgi:hypothetical protein
MLFGTASTNNHKKTDGKILLTEIVKRKIKKAASKT